MRRALLLTVAFGGFLAGVGCKQICGRNDCTNDPNDAHIPAPGNPYPTIGAPIVGTAPAAAATPMVAPEKLPEAKGK